MSQIPLITEEQVVNLLTWESTFEAVECSMKEVARNNVVQPPRNILTVNDTYLYTMPGCLNNEKFGALACKLVTRNLDNQNRNPPLPSINGIIVYFCPESGAVKAVIEAKEITKWRTAAASAVATQHIFVNNKKQCLKLAILGAGDQGLIHARCFQHLFKFKQVLIWNRHQHRAEKLVDLLNQEFKDIFQVAETVEDCVKNADVIVTTTHADEPLIKKEFLKDGVHINAVGTGGSHSNELESSIYLNSDVYIDHQEGANTELKSLKDLGVQFCGTVGDIILNGPPTLRKTYTIFQSLGMSVEDCAMARLIHDLYIRKQ